MAALEATHAAEKSQLKDVCDKLQAQMAELEARHGTEIEQLQKKVEELAADASRAAVLDSSSSWRHHDQARCWPPDPVRFLRVVNESGGVAYGRQPDFLAAIEEQGNKAIDKEQIHAWLGRPAEAGRPF